MWLYPGDTDKEPGAPVWLDDVAYTLDIYNPVSLRLAAHKIIGMQCDVVIFDWWTLIWQPGFAYMARILRKHGVKVIFLCHNLFDHDAHGFKRKVAESLLRQADGYIVHAEESAALLRELRPEAPIMKRLHPIYGHFPEAPTALKNRGRLELLFFGLIRPYKGLDLLVEALGKLQDKDVYLTVAGEVWGNEAELRQQLAGYNAPNLDLHFGYASSEEAAQYFARADVVVLPYRSATASGVLSLAYNYGKPVLATRVGGLPDGIVESKTGWLVDVSADALAEAIAHITRKNAQDMAHDISSFCAAHSWEAFAAEVCAFAQALVIGR
jgi:glycosyltransferase involved in cell wall biosynthesis